MESPRKERPDLGNDAHLGASWNSQHYWNQGDTWKRSYEGFTFQRIYNSFGPYVDGIPDFSYSTGTNPTGWTGPAHTLISPTAEIEMSDSVSIFRGQRSLRTGVMIIRNRKDQNAPPALLLDPLRHGRNQSEKNCSQRGKNCDPSQLIMDETRPNHASSSSARLHISAFGAFLQAFARPG